MLTAYETATRRLLQNPEAPTSLYSAPLVLQAINSARGQLAGEAECIRVLGTIDTVIGQRAYAFSSIDIGVAATTGVSGAIHVRSMRYAIASGYQWIAPRAWPWFELYYLNNPVPGTAAPTSWAQFGQGGSNQGTGSGATGSFFIDPPPDNVYELTCDCVCFPQALAIDADIEAIPYLFTDAVPFLAAWYVLLSSQTNARTADAERMFNYYTTFLQRARQFANPSVLRSQYEQAVDQTVISKLGLQQKTAQGGQG